MTQSTTGHAHVNYLKEFLNHNYTLRAHAELPNYDFPLFEGRLCSLKSFTQFRLTCPSLQNENSSLNEGILAFDKSSGVMNMKKWNKKSITDLESLIFDQLTDQEIAKKLNQLNKQWNFTAMSVKRKRHRLSLFKKVNAIINESNFYVKVSKKSGKGFSRAFFPFSLIKKCGLKDKDFLILRKNNTLFMSKLKENHRKDRWNNSFTFYIPFELINSIKYNSEIIEYLGKVNCKENLVNKKSLIIGSKIDLLKLLSNKINDKIQSCLNPLNKNIILINTGRASVPEKLPRYLEISEHLMQTLGLFQGEGSKGHFRRIEFVNSDSSIINRFLDFFQKYFSIERKRWTYRLIYTNEAKDETLEKKLMNLWSESINIPKNNFVKIKLWVGTPDAKTGSIHIYLPSSAFRELWFNLLKLSTKLIQKDKNHAKWFLQGVLAADGCPIFSKGKISGIMVRIENQYEGELYQSAFKTLGISANLSVKHRKVSFYGSSQLQKVSELELFMLHKERNEKFKKGMLGRNIEVKWKK